MGMIDVAEGQKLARQDELWAARGRAIQGYAGLERALCGVLAMTGDMSNDVASLIFFKLTSHARTQIIRKLLRKAFGNAYEPFWKSAFKGIDALTNTRNHIVHWSALATYGADSERTTVEVVLKPAELRAEDTFDEPDLERLTAEDMREFEAECDYWARAIARFCRATSDHDEPDPHFNRSGWLEAFQQPLTYPPSPQHPRFDLVEGLLPRT